MTLQEQTATPSEPSPFADSTSAPWANLVDAVSAATCAPLERPIPAAHAHLTSLLRPTADIERTEAQSPTRTEASAPLVEFALIMALWDAPLADVTFPGTHGDALSRESFLAWHAQLRDAELALIAAERTLMERAAERTRLNAHLVAQATRAMAYARVFAIDDAALTARIDNAERAFGVLSTRDRVPAPNMKVRRKRQAGHSVIELGQAQLHGLSGDSDATRTTASDAERCIQVADEVHAEKITTAASANSAPGETDLNNAERQIQRFGGPKSRKRQRNLKIEHAEPSIVDDF
jgi:hypothetical protein